MALAGKNGCSCDLRGTHCNRAIVVLCLIPTFWFMLTGHKKDEIERLFGYVQSFLFN